MGKKTVHNPHDQFFKILFSDPEKVEAYLKGALPEEIAQKLDYSTLTIENNNYVDEQLQDFYADVVYQCQYVDQGRIQLAFLFEHKSFISKYPHLQLLRYMLNIWERRLKEKLPLLPVIPMVIYHGKRKWNQKPLNQYFETALPGELYTFIPDFNYLLTNLQDERENTIRDKYDLLSLQMGFLMMKSIREKELLEKLEEIFQGIESLIKEEKEKDYVQQLFVYLYFGTTLEKSLVMEKAFDISRMAGEFPKTPGAQIFREGKAAGKAEGMELMIQFFIEKLLKRGFKTEFIAELLELPTQRVITLTKNLPGKDKQE